MVHPKIVCLSPDAVTSLIYLEAVDFLAGRPSGMRYPELKGIPCIGSYGKPDLARILDSAPDFVVGYSDIHAPIMAELIARHISVIALNHTSMEGIFDSVRMLGGLVKKCVEADALIAESGRRLAAVGRRRLPRRPKVFFEEWPDPVTCAPLWVSEMIEAAGGTDLFSERARKPMFSKRRIDLDEVVERDPDVIFASWCGRPFNLQRMIERPGWNRIRAVQSGNVFTLPGQVVLQPGPRVVDGVETMNRLLSRVVESWP